MEKNAIVFLGLMAVAYKKFDLQFTHADGKKNHTNGLNIFAAIIDNSDVELLGQQQNQIHKGCNPMLHAEKLALHEAIEKLKIKNPRNDATTSIENYYREFLFNRPNTPGDFTVGATIYTTLEPCPFCTSALLVTRMKRIVYILPDPDFGGAFGVLKQKFYGKYDMTYGQIVLSGTPGSELTRFAAAQYATLLHQSSGNPQPATQYLDGMEPLLKTCSDYFLGLTADSLNSQGDEFAKNLKTLSGLQANARE